MKTKNKKALTIKFATLDEIRRDTLDTIKFKKPYIQLESEQWFTSIDGFRNFMTIQKLEILTLIASAQPKSIYELAKMTGRSVAPVQKDCEILERTGFIKFEKQKTGRKTITPRLKFNYDRIIVELPKYPYELIFRAAA